MSLSEEAQALLLYQFKDAPKLKGLIACLMAPLDELLRQTLKLHHGRYIAEASHRSLDVLGELVDFARTDMSDEEYKLWLTTAVLLNNGKGTASSVLNIVRVFFGPNQQDQPTVEISEHDAKVVIITIFIESRMPNKILFSIIRRAVPLCVRCEFVDAGMNTMKMMKSAPKKVFQFDVSGFDQSFFADFFREVA